MKIAIQHPTVGSKPYYGNFSLGVMVDSHPRFLNVIVALVIVEVVISFTFAPAMRPVAVVTPDPDA